MCVYISLFYIFTFIFFFSQIQASKLEPLEGGAQKTTPPLWAKLATRLPICFLSSSSSLVLSLFHNFFFSSILFIFFWSIDLSEFSLFPIST